ncbi:MAG: inositol monophosphatase family protein [Thermodesulfobacteriota bacterium]
MAPAENRGIDDLTRFAMKTLERLGEESLKFYGKGDHNMKFDEELVTTAELHLTQLFQDRLEKNFPEHQVLESYNENGAYTHDEKRYLWILDAIDGVDNFQTGIPVWAVSLSLLENFWPIFGVIHMPATGDFFHAQAGRAAFRGKQKISISAQKGVDDESLLLTFSRFHLHYNSSFPGKIRNLGCTSAHICYVAMGRADAAIIANESFKGLAAARVLIESAGGKILKLDGSDFHLNEYLGGEKIDDHLLVVAPKNLPAIMSCLRKVS